MSNTQGFLVRTTLLSLVSLLFFPLAPAGAQEVTINAPSDGETVSGDVQITGTTSDLGDGRVAISIDDGPFVPADGVATWTFTWATSGLTAGDHTITARARACVTCPPFLDSVTVSIGNDTTAVAFLFPEDGAAVIDTLVATGTSTQAHAVELSVDEGPFQLANGLDPWTVVFEPGSLSPGPHILTARALGESGAESRASITIEVGEPPPGIQTFTYLSSVDSEPMAGVYYVGAGFDRASEPTALVIHLHGGGGTGVISETMQEALDAKGWIGISPDGREWGLHDPDNPESCPWRTSAAYVDSPDPNVGPGEQDIFDAIAWAQEAFEIDPDRIYLHGFSMGGRGAYAIGLKNPDFFAAIAPMGPAIDMYEVFVRRPEPAACKEGMVGGPPGESPKIDTFYSITSGRFLIENAYNLPVFHGHGTLDHVANNDPNLNSFLHGWHITEDGTWGDCHGESDLCFGHTPTLGELRAHHSGDPAAYPWAFFFSPVEHVTDPRWLLGGHMETGDFGVEDPNAPGEWLGLYDFFASHQRVASPETVVFKSYTDTHRRAYWLDLLITTPWQNRPGAIRAQRKSEMNELSLEMVRVAEIRVALEEAGLSLESGSLFIDVDWLIEPAYDPALAAPGEALKPTIILEGDFASLEALEVLLAGEPFPDELLSWDTEAITLGPLNLTSKLRLELFASHVLFADAFESGDTTRWSEAASGVQREDPRE